MKKWGFLFAAIIFFLCINLIFKHLNPDSNRPNGLHPIVSGQSEQLMEMAKKKGIDVIITDGFRSFEEQNLLYAKGRTEEGKIITYAKGGESYHNYGLAIDFALLNKKQEPIWDMTYDGNGNGKSDWLEVVDIARQLGFEWGGDWQGFKDYPHLQMDFGLSIQDLQKGKRPPEQSLYVHK